MRNIMSSLKHSEIQRMVLILLPMIIGYVLWHSIRLSFNFGAIAWGMPSLSDDFILNTASFPSATFLVQGVLVYLLSFLFKGKHQFFFKW